MMEVALIILLVVIVIAKLAQPSVRVMIVMTGQPEEDYQPPEPTPPDDPYKPISVDLEYLSTLKGETQVQLMRIAAEDHLRCIRLAIKDRKPDVARRILRSLIEQFPDAKINGVERMEQIIAEMERNKS
ncbi:hypothetical protein GKE73_16485 [Paludibacterium sp. dN 18-1]|uniref:Uncharacterized protein n=2 Tax=Paludibacterium denitrificans TaxID=2675226 RepID=A0A844GFD6_9NEIS|nr:hypothetical protein [Paludibacterium denitrificans]